MKLISDALAQTEQPAPSAAEPAPAAPSAAPAETAVAPAAAPAKAESATTPAAPAAPATTPTKTGTVAPTTAPPPGQPEMPGIADLFAQIVPFLVIIGIVYIIVIRPQQRKQKEADAQLRSVRRGDVVVVNGFIGKVTKVVDEAEFEFEPGPNLRLRALLSAISEVRSRGEPVKDAPPPSKPARDATPPAKPSKGAPPAAKPSKDAPPAES
jgi:preprotein translocase subunit YajC